MKHPDIEIDGSMGFYSITGITLKGRNWVNRFVEDADNGRALTDDTRMASDIADGAFEDCLEVSVNGRLYAGNGAVWVDPFIYANPCWLKEEASEGMVSNG